jgi:hypothetical protein
MVSALAGEVAVMSTYPIEKRIKAVKKIVGRPKYSAYKGDFHRVCDGFAQTKNSATAWLMGWQRHCAIVPPRSGASVVCLKNRGLWLVDTVILWNRCWRRMPEVLGRRGLDRKLDYLVRQRATLRAQITLQRRSGSPDATKIADYQRRIQELEAMMQRLLNPTATQ